MLSRPKGLASLLLVMAVAVLVAACGSSNSSSTSTTASTGAASTTSGSSGVDEAKQLVQKAMQEPPFNGPTAKVPIDKAKGKTVYYVSLTEEIPALHEWGVVLAQQLAAAGVKTTKCDGKGKLQAPAN